MPRPIVGLWLPRVYSRPASHRDDDHGALGPIASCSNEKPGNRPGARKVCAGAEMRITKRGTVRSSAHK